MNHVAELARRRIEEEIARLVQTEEWQAQARRNNVFKSPGMRRPLAGYTKPLAPVARVGSKPGVTPPTDGIRSMKLSSGKRLRLN